MNPTSGPGTTQSQHLVEPPLASDDAPLAAENCVVSSQSEDQLGFQSMYCKELLFMGPSEFCFEELRAERYFASMQQKLKERQMHLNKEKERLRQLIEQKLQAKSTPAQENGPPSRNTEIYPDNKFLPEEEASERNVQPRPFTVFNENTASALPHETAPVVARSKSLKLPTPILKTHGSPSYTATEKDCTDRSPSQAEKAIVNSHCNKTLSISPDDTYDFARAAVLASTPFGGVRGQSTSTTDDVAVTKVLWGVPAESCPNTTPQTPAEPTQTNKLSPILEVSQEWHSVSTVAQRTHHTAGPVSSTSVTLPPVLDEAEEDLEQEMEIADPHEDQAIDPCSLDVRRCLLHETGLCTLPDLHPVPSPLPSSILRLRLGDQMLSYLLKMPDLENHYILASEEAEEDAVVLKVDRSPVPWDFYICSQLKARLPAGTEGHFLNHSSSFLFEDGCHALEGPQRNNFG